jgi:hypothetical protein
VGCCHGDRPDSTAVSGGVKWNDEGMQGEVKMHTLSHRTPFGELYFSYALKKSLASSGVQ